jgi:hypothetical protein
MGWKKACELRARQKLAERVLITSIGRARERIGKITANGGDPKKIAKWSRRIVRYHECLEQLRSTDWGAAEEARL